MIQSDYSKIISLIEKHKAKLLTNLNDIKSITPFQIDVVRTQFFYMLKDLDKYVLKGVSNDQKE